MSFSGRFWCCVAGALVFGWFGFGARAFAQDSKINEPPAGFKAIFNGKDLANWRGQIAEDPRRVAKLLEGLSADEKKHKQDDADRKTFAHWVVSEGTIHYDGAKGIGNIETRAEFGDFELYLDWKITPKGDSGVFLRNMPQVQIWDPKHQKVGSGGLYNNMPRVEPLKTADKPTGEWNTFHIKMVGDMVWIKLNGELVIDGAVQGNYWSEFKQPAPPRGVLVLQSHGTPLWFRNVFIKELAGGKEGAGKGGDVKGGDGKEAAIVPADAKLEKVAGGCKFTEGPAADAEGNLFFTDSPRNLILVVRPGGKLDVWNKDSKDANGMRFDAKGRLLACCGEGGARAVVRWDKDGKRTLLAERFHGKRLTAPNDLCIDQQGRVYFTDPCYGRKPADGQERYACYRIEAKDGEPIADKVTRVIDDVDTPNGIAISPDGKTLYVADNAARKKGPHTLVAYDILADGSCKRRAVLHDFEEGRGIDGMVVDTQGNIYATAGSGAKTGVYIFSPAGKQLGFIRTPETATNCTFGDKDLKTLYITAGTSLYKIRVNAAGFLPYPPL